MRQYAETGGVEKTRQFILSKVKIKKVALNYCLQYAKVYNGLRGIKKLLVSRFKYKLESNLN